MTRGAFPGAVSVSVSVSAPSSALTPPAFCSPHSTSDHSTNDDTTVPTSQAYPRILTLDRSSDLWIIRLACLATFVRLASPLHSSFIGTTARNACQSPSTIIGRKSKPRPSAHEDDYNDFDGYDDFLPSSKPKPKPKAPHTNHRRRSRRRGTTATMGQQESTPLDADTPPLTLRARDLPSLASYILSPRCRRIAILSGAGISTSAGIPDFRSPSTGLYANLARLNLPYAEAVFSIEYFRQNPEPFYTLAQELYPGRYRPTVTHCFIAMLCAKDLLGKHFTQNIDCLDREAGVPAEKVVEAHGSFATQRCIDCGRGFAGEEMRSCVAEKRIPRCEDAECRGLVKPDIVFFGEALPQEFFRNRGAVADADLVVVMGTSLQVQPFASLPLMAREGVPRLLINLEQVGGLGTRPDDVLLLGDCDEGVRKLAEALGWSDELEELWEETGKKFPKVENAPQERWAGRERNAKVEERTADEKLEDEVERLTREVDETLRLNKQHADEARREVGETVKYDVAGTGGGVEITAPLTNGEMSKPDLEAAAEVKKEKGGLDHVFPHAPRKSPSSL